MPGRMLKSRPMPPVGHGSSEEMFRALLESAPDAIVIVNDEGEIVLVNAQTERLFGYPREELFGMRVEMLVPDRFRGAHAGHRSGYSTDPHARAMGEGLELYARRKDGTEFPVEISLSPLKTEAGMLVSGAVRDISERTRAEEREAHLAAVVESSHDAIISKRLDGTVVSWNPGAERLYGYTAAEVHGRPISLLLPPGSDDDFPEILKEVIAGERLDNYETVRMRKDGTHVDVSLTVSPIRDARGNVVGASTIARDISDRLRYQEQLRHLAEHDALTGARNRRRFERDLADQIGRSRRYGEPAAVLMIDVDRFKQINDRYGHKAGDRALQGVAGALRQRLRESDVIARLGGDEFAVLLPYADASQASVIAADLRRRIAELRIDVDAEEPVRIAVSVGYATIGRNTTSDESVLAEADRAMYRDKLSRRAAGR
jgi:diguanylate cyclase (GGDEF)-like protein/PAS domain S-box-containing protein